MNINEPLQAHIPLLRRLWREAFGDTEDFLNTFFATAFRTDHCRCVMVNDEVIAALYWFDCLHMNRPIAYLYAVATAEEYRGQGICHKLISDTHLHLKKLGYEGAILVPGNKKLFSFYESMGYQNCSHIQEFDCIGNAKTLPLYRIEKDAYARLRRKLLPHGGVIQENTNLDFLQTQAKFYAGPGFLLAARADGDTLYGIELLGNASFAPGIVQALGYIKGVFRTPGNGMPFAMFIPLGDSNSLPPSYFGLAFD